MVYLIMFCFFLIEATLFRKIFIRNTVPDTVTVFVVFFAFSYGWKFGIELGLVSGLIKDLQGVQSFGLHMLIFSILGAFCGFLADKVYKENFLAQLVIVFITTLFVSGFYVIHAVYTILIFPFIFFSLRGLLKLREGML